MLNFSDPVSFLMFIVALLTAITVHEAAHAFMANRLGDPTPRLQGRLTLNPLAHLDPLGTLMLFIFHFGWGKPVQFDPFNLRNPQRDSALISFAGPVSNFLTATLFAIVLRLNPGLIDFMLPLIQLNIVLGVFNLIPIHPLDGGKVLVGLLEGEQARQIDRFLAQYGIFLIILMFLPIFGGVSILQLVILPLVSFFFNILVTQAPFI